MTTIRERSIVVGKILEKIWVKSVKLHQNCLCKRGVKSLKNLPQSCLGKHSNLLVYKSKLQIVFQTKKTTALRLQKPGRIENFSVSIY